MMTLDTLNAYYFGPVKSSSKPPAAAVDGNFNVDVEDATIIAAAPTVTLSPCGTVADEVTTRPTPDAKTEGHTAVITPCHMTTSGQEVKGGAVAVQNGTGQGQVRRIVSWASTSHNPGKHHKQSVNPAAASTSLCLLGLF